MRGTRQGQRIADRYSGRKKPLTDYQKRAVEAIGKGIQLFKEDEAYQEYLKSVRASEFKANPLNNDPLVSQYHLEVGHS